MSKNKRVSRKRMKKMLMAAGFSRNYANAVQGVMTGVEQKIEQLERDKAPYARQVRMEWGRLCWKDLLGDAIESIEREETLKGRRE